jgi:hypothetical protein
LRSAAEYRQLVAQVTATLNSRHEVAGKLEIEWLHLQPLPVERFADYEPFEVDWFFWTGLIVNL